MARENCATLLVYTMLLVPAIVYGRSISSHILGGGEAADGAWPWQLSIRYAGTHSCGAAVISGKAAVTAAQCVGNSAILYEVVAGTNNRSCDDDSCVTRRVETIVRHPDFVNSGSEGYPNDLAVISWLVTLLPSAKIRTISLATSDTHLDCVVTGWGRLSATSAMPELLQEAPIDIISQTTCQNQWSSVKLIDSQVCVQDVNQKVSPCKGDDGGPLVCKTSWTSQWELVGIVSWGRNGCPTSVATVCTRVTSYVDWVNSVVSSL